MRISGARVGRMVHKELRQMFRDIRMRGLIFVAPLIQLVVFGYAVSTDVRQVPTFVVDYDRTPASRQLVDWITASGYFRVSGVSDRSGDLRAALEDRSATVALEIPRGYADDVAAGRAAAVQVLVDGTDSNTGNIALSYIVRIVQRAGADMVRAPAGVSLEARAWYNPALESRVYNVPAVMGLLLLLITMLLTALGVVREREIGTWDQLLVSPVSATELMLGKVIPVALVGLLDLVLVSTAAILWFQIPLRGSPLVLLAAALPFLIAGLSIGLIISTLSNTQQEAFMSSFLVLLPALIFSGFMFPVSSMPQAFQHATLLNPVRHFLVVVRSVFLKGTGFADHWEQYLALYAMAGAGLWFGVSRFRRMVGA
ncbi:MAG TPA: ABC transporter permease [Gemmatimonadales bacterium]